MSDDIREDINQALTAAVKAQEKRRMGTLRLVKAALKDRDIAARTAGNGDGVTNSEVLDILAKMIKQRRESIKTYEEAGRLELATQEQEEIDVITDFLPKQLSEAEMQSACEAVVDELECNGLKDMGRTMSALKERHAGTMDFGKASAVVKSLLGK